MNKNDLIQAVVKKTGLAKNKASEALDTVFDEISKALSEKKEVTVPGFGKFVAASRKARMGVNPKTGEKISIPATTVPKFKAGKALKDLVK